MAQTADKGTVLENRDDEKAVGSNGPGSDSDGTIFSGINEKALLRKLDRHLLPAVGILYLLSFLDRSNGMFPTLLYCEHWLTPVSSRQCEDRRPGGRLGHVRKPISHRTDVVLHRLRDI